MITFYCRTSRPKRDKDGKLVEWDLGIAGQEKAMRSRFTPDLIFKDEGITGKKRDRPGLNELLDAIKANEVSTVVVYSISRIARSVKHLVELEELFRAHEVKFISIVDGFDTSSATGRMVFHILASVAQFEAEISSERTIASLKAAREKGVRLGRKERVIEATKIQNLPSKVTVREAAKILDVGYGTAYKFLKKRKA